MVSGNQRKAMFANIKGRNVKIGTRMTINTGIKDRRVILQERHMGNPNQLCVKYRGKKFLVPKSAVTKIG
jgi:ribosome maturation factor RimP